MSYETRRDFYLQVAADNLRLIEAITSHSSRLQVAISKLTEATSDLVAILGNEIAMDRDEGREGAA